MFEPRSFECGLESKNSFPITMEFTKEVDAMKLLNRCRSSYRLWDSTPLDTVVDDSDSPEMSSEWYRQIYQELSIRVCERSELSKLFKKLNDRIKNNDSRIKLLEQWLGLRNIDQLRGIDSKPSTKFEMISRINLSKIIKKSASVNAALMNLGSPDFNSEKGFVSQDNRFEIQKSTECRQMVVISIPKNNTNVEKAATFMTGLFEEIGGLTCFTSNKNDIEKVDVDGNLVTDGSKGISRWMWEFQQMLNEFMKPNPVGTILIFNQGYGFEKCKSQLWEINELARRQLLSFTRLVVFDEERSIENQMITIWRTKTSYLTVGYPIEFFLLDKWEGSSALWTRMTLFFRTTDFRVDDQVDALHDMATGYQRATVKKVHSGNREFDLDYNDPITLQEIWGPRSGKRLKCPRRDIRSKDINALVGLACSQPLIYAVRNNLQVTIKYLLKWSKMGSEHNYSDVNCKDVFGNTPLHIACDSGNFWVVGLLLNSKADSSIRNGKDMTCLVLAAAQGYKAIVDVLIAKTVNVSAVENERNINEALWISAERGHLTTAASLVKNKADVNIADNESRTPLILAAREGHEQMCKYLLILSANIECSDQYGRTPLIWATAEGKLEVIEVLLKANANVDAQDSDGQTPLMWAASEDYDEICAILLENGANLMKVDAHFGRTCLMRAAIEGNLNTISTLVDHKAHLEHSDNDGRTAFMLASEFAHTSIVLSLLNLKANVNAKDWNGRTALVEATKRGEIEAVELLLNANADVSLIDKFGWTALMWAAKRGFHQIIQCLIKANGQVNAEIRGVTVLMRAAAEGHSDAVSLLLRSKADVKKHERSRSRTALMKAAQGGHEDTVRVLLMAGADATDQDNNQDTATVIARKRGHPTVVEVLEKYKRNQFQKDFEPSVKKTNNITVENVKSISANFPLSNFIIRPSEEVHSNSESTSSLINLYQIDIQRGTL